MVVVVYKSSLMFHSALKGYWFNLCLLNISFIPYTALSPYVIMLIDFSPVYTFYYSRWCTNILIL